jgi:hypothetical protein
MPVTAEIVERQYTELTAGCCGWVTLFVGTVPSDWPIGGQASDVMCTVCAVAYPAVVSGVY